MEPLSTNSRTYFYTETAYHHMGDMAFLKSLIDSSAEIGAKGVKFQVLIDYDSFIADQHSMYEEFKKGTFTLHEWREIFSYTNSKGLDIIFMPICTDSFQLLRSEDYQIKFLDIHSVSFYDQEVLDLIQESKLPIILGIGGRTTEEVDAKIAFFGDQLKILMVGFQAFPTHIQEMKIGKIAWLKNKYPQLKIGYADHSPFDSEHAIVSNEWAYLLGATYFEKHITTLPGVNRWDWQSALSVENTKALIEKIRFLDEQVMAFSDSDFDQIEGKELTYRNRQKIAVALKPLTEGHVLMEEDIALKMLDSTEGIVDWKSLIGKTCTQAILKGEKLHHHNLDI